MTTEPSLTHVSAQLIAIGKGKLGGLGSMKDFGNKTWGRFNVGSHWKNRGQGRY